VSTAAALALSRPRACPVCGDSDASHERYPERIDPSRLGALSYSSRKEPERLNLRMVVCSGCELLYAPQVPSTGYLERAYADTGFDGAGEARHAAASYAEALHAQLTELPDRRSALEIGTGNGALLEHLSAMGFAEIMGIEPSIAAVRDAAPEMRPLIRIGSFDPSGLPASHFSLLIANQTIEHVAEPLALLASARALLKPGGLLMMVSHDYRHPLMRLLGRRAPIIDIEHLQVFSRASLAFALDRAGFAEARIAPFANRYPLHYWVRLSPLPRLLKRPLHGWLRRGAAGGLGGMTLRASVGNMIAWARA
jgi:SAM-dependent methyltransferase